MVDDYLNAARARTDRRSGNGFRTIAVTAVIAFVVGGLVAAAIAYRAGLFDQDAQRPAIVAAEPTDEADLTEPALPPVITPSATGTASVADVQQVARATGGLDQRLAALEQRINRLDLQSEAAAGNAARAEGLLIAFAARRAIDRGDQLGYLSEQLRVRFGDAQPNAVSTILEESREPITLDQLLARLEGLQTRLVSSPPEEGLWGRIRREAGSLFTFRRESTPSPMPSRRIARARLFLESGRIQAAIAEVANLPGAPAARAWLDDAGRYAALHQALDRIESAAVLEPRRLRDGEGEAIEQRSPVAEPGAN